MFNVLMRSAELEDYATLVTNEQLQMAVGRLEIAIDRLKNHVDERFNTLDAKNQRAAAYELGGYRERSSFRSSRFTIGRDTINRPGTLEPSPAIESRAVLLLA
jgi:hypothetical protein